MKLLDKPAQTTPASAGRMPLVAVLLVVIVTYACSAYANLAFAVSDPVSYRYFPPFESGVNENNNRHLGAEYFSIAKAMYAGRGFADPFKEPTGPTACMPPVLPTFLAGLLWACDGDEDAVMAVVIFLQVNVLVATGLLVLALTWQSTRRIAPTITAIIFLGATIAHFRHSFQFLHDSWLILLAADLLIAGLVWFRPLQSRLRAVGWGVFGGLAALVNPVLALVWGVFTLLMGYQRRAWGTLAVALLLAGLTLLPWTIRNFLVFGRLIPVKSNLAYELYQSQCLQPDGLLRNSTFGSHPYSSAGRTRREYKAMGEMAFNDQKRDQFWEAVKANPQDFFDRVADRFLGTMIWYDPHDRSKEAKRPWVLVTSRIIHPLPFLGMLVLIFASLWRRLDWAQWIVIGVYILYLLPYIAVSYYERYAIPLLGVKVLLVIWGADCLLSFLPKKPARHEIQKSSPITVTAEKQLNAASSAQCA